MAEYVLEVALGLVFIIFLLIYNYTTSEYLYWKKRNIPYLEPSFPFGNIKDQIMNTLDVGNAYKKLYDKMPGVKYFGIFELGKPTLVLKDPDVIKTIMVRDFSYFIDRGHIHEDVTEDFFSAGFIFNLKGEKWKQMRLKLAPTFSSGRMKMMYHLMYQISIVFSNFLKPLADKNSILDFKDLMVRFTSDIIGSCALGIETNTIINEENVVSQITKLFFMRSSWNAIKLYLSINTPRLYNFLGLEQTHPKVKQFCLQIARDSYNYRINNNVYRDDFLDLLIKIKQNKNLHEDEKDIKKQSRRISSEENGLTFEEMASQIFIIFAGGFETSSTLSSTALYELAMHLEIQEKVRKEIDEVLQRHDGKITYEAFKEMTYTEKVIYEVLRRYAPFPILTRKCTQTYTMPDSDLIIEKGTRIIIPVLALHHDPQYFPDPYTFDPERFSPEQVRNRPNCVSLPFGEGPMICIGQRFGKMQVKCVLATILSEFEVSQVPETPRQLTIDPCQFLTATNPILLRVSKRKDK